MNFSKIKKELLSLRDPKQAAIYQRFFKTGKGEYSEGDVFLGIKVPILRQIAKKYQDVSLEVIQELLDDKIHELRFLALVILIKKFQRKNNSTKDKKNIFLFFLKNTKNINNWDLVDISAPSIPGVYLYEFSQDRKTLYRLVKSKNLWERRIAILSCFYFIRQNDFKDFLKIARGLIDDEHDLIHKALGWMLREIGKRDLKILESFLEKHKKQMPRVMLRYAIEKMSKEKRKYYLS